MNIRIIVGLCLVSWFLYGCGDNTSSRSQVNLNSSSETAQPVTPEEEPPTRDEVQEVELDRYTLANRCFVLRSQQTGHYVARASDGHYTVTADQLDDASRFYFKPSDLGQYLLYADNHTLLSATGGRLTSTTALADKSGWQLGPHLLWRADQDTHHDFLFASEQEQAGTRVVLGVDGDTLALLDGSTAAAAQRFQLQPEEGCAAFPEIATDTLGTTYHGNGVDKPVVGFADIHSHLSATDFLGGARVGQPFSRYGVVAALPEGKHEHGFTGFFDLIGNIYGGDPFDLHDTQGWPTFADWPAPRRLTYENAYYKWVERTYQAGLRLLVNNLVQNDVLCALNSVVQTANPGDPDLAGKLKRALEGVRGFDSIPDGLLNGLLEQALNGELDGLIGNSCNDMETAVHQADFMYRMQRYIDAQAGGPGKGWFRIVNNPADARRVINDGKLAVVLGIEMSNVLDCKLTQVHVLGTTLVDQPRCDKEMIGTNLDRLYELGVRQINLIHEFNNALGGTGLINGDFLNLGNFGDTGAFWQTHDCPEQEYYVAPGTMMLSLNPLDYAGDNPLSGLLNGLLQGTLPTYNTQTRQCNNRGITDLGRYALEQTMARHMMIDVDHMSVKMKSEVIDYASQRHPVYPLISSHGGHGGMSRQQAIDIEQMGGVISPARTTAENWIEQLHQIASFTPPDREVAVGFSSDVNGMATQPGPRGEGSEPISYPFTLFQGADWGHLFDGIEPVTFEMSCVPEGQRCFDLNQEGVAHYGLYADWVESVRLAGGADALNALYRSAERYLQVWEAVQ